MRTRLTALASATLAATTLLAGAAQAGHTNPLLTASLDGREEVDPANPSARLVGDPDGMGEAYVFGIDDDPTTLCYTLTVEKIQLVPVGEGMMAHIHEGVRDQNGPIVAALAGPEDGNAADCLTEGETGKFPTGEAGIVARILADPANFYVNVHNPQYPNGAIRGQLRSQGEHSTDGAGTDGGTDMGMGGASGAPTVPMNLTAQAYSDNAGELMWERSADDVRVTGYEIFLDGMSVAEVLGNSYFVQGLQAGTAHEYTVEAIDNAENRSGMSDPVTLTTRD